TAIMLGFGMFAASPVPDEGMWLPMFVERLNWTDIQKMGLKLTPEELYSINNSSLKDAIVGLANGSAPNGYFCTGEIVSDQGLLFTNHHCGYDVIQNHSTVEHDYLTDGFWAMKMEDELPNPNLTASFLISMEDLTAKILPELNDTLSPADRAKKVKEIVKPIKEAASENGKYDVVVKSFYEGNEYYMFVYQTYKDVRLVGAPPESIGKFGGDTDNWMWPRQTGDFSIFRVYSAPDGSPAEYSKDNVPFKPKHYLPISLKGYQKDDYAMVWGYPGSTERYLTSYGVDFAIEKKNPAIIDVFGKVLENMKVYMDSDPALRIEYASDYASIANSWKYFIGQTKGLKKLNVKGEKEKIEQEFTNWVNASPDRKTKYGKLLENVSNGYEMMTDKVTPYYYLAIGSGQISMFELPRQSMQLSSMLEEPKENKTAIEESVKAMKESAEEFYASFNPVMDKDLLKSMLKMFKAKLLPEQLPGIFVTIDKKLKGNIDAYVDNMYEKSMFSDKEKLLKFLDKPSKKKLDRDPAFFAVKDFMGGMMNYQGGYSKGENLVYQNMRYFIAALREMHPDKKYFPDANSSMRFSYGTVEDYYPADAVHYDYVTNLKGVMEKEDPKNPEFIVPSKLKELFNAKDFGQYGKDGQMITCFLTTNDITGGNSGSPVMNGNGELIGLAFDGNWEAMSGDIAFEPELQRTINVDIRYVLFIIDKFAGAKNLINELTLVK
ncbi:MAG: S46 family peptidase, partial [Bacteroidales bacterium]